LDFEQRSPALEMSRMRSACSVQVRVHMCTHIQHHTQLHILVHTAIHGHMHVRRCDCIQECLVRGSYSLVYIDTPFKTHIIMNGVVTTVVVVAAVVVTVSSSSDGSGSSNIAFVVVVRVLQ
jgi:hypothetical protein